MPVDLEALYPKLIRLMLDTVLVIDGDEQIVFVSDACEALIPDAAGESLSQLLIKDESENDYLYSRELFVSVDLPSNTEKAVISAA